MSKFLKSFFYAFRGIKAGLEGRNFKVQLFAAFFVISAAIFFQISTFEWLIILICIGVVLSAELFNTAIEDICNLLKHRLKLDYSATTIARDLAAGAVLVVAAVSALVGLIIFLPKIVILFFL